MSKNRSPYCKNCNNPINGNYCSNCGQSSETGKIDFHYLIHEVQHSILHVDKGILYTIKELVLRPGSTIRSYLSGKRVNYFKPFAFVFILGTLYGFIAHFFKYYPENEIMPSLGYTESSLKYTQKTMELIYSNYSLAILILVPFSAFSTFIFFRKSIYNYWEHLIANSYIAGMQILILLIFYLLNVCFDRSWIFLIGSFITYLYSIWVLVELFNDGSKIKTAIKATFSIICSFLILTFITFIAAIIAIIFLNILGPWKA